MTTQDTTVTMRRCIGSTKFGIEAHEASAVEFPAQPSQKDGLGRMCKPHWRQYTNALRKAAVARKTEEAAPEVVAAEAEPGEDAASAVPSHEHTLAASLVGEGEPVEPPGPRRSRRAKAPLESGADAA